MEEKKHQKASTLLQAFKNKKVLIIGDVMIDCYWHGSVKRISPEAPVPIFEWEREENRLGGAANVALNVKALGAHPILMSVVGDDDSSYTFERLLQSEKIETEGILRDSTRATTRKTRVVAGTHQMLRIDSEITSDLGTDTNFKLIGLIQNHLDSNTIDVIILQDYNKGVLTPSIIETTIANARKRRIPIAVDPKNKNFWDYKNVTLFKPNLKEISDAFLSKINPTLFELNNAAFFLQQKLNPSHILITLSEKGVYLKSGDTPSAIYPTIPRHISDVSGAGDTVISVAALCLASQIQGEVLARLANLAGGIVCEHAGIVPINLEQLTAEFQKTL